MKRCHTFVIFVILMAGCAFYKNETNTNSKKLFSPKLQHIIDSLTNITDSIGSYKMYYYTIISEGATSDSSLNIYVGDGSVARLNMTREEAEKRQMPISFVGGVAAMSDTNHIFLIDSLTLHHIKQHVNSQEFSDSLYMKYVMKILDRPYMRYRVFLE